MRSAQGEVCPLRAVVARVKSERIVRVCRPPSPWEVAGSGHEGADVAPGKVVIAMNSAFAATGRTLITVASVAALTASCSSEPPGPARPRQESVVPSASPDPGSPPAERDAPTRCIDEEALTFYARGTGHTTVFRGGRCTEAQLDALVEACFAYEGDCQAAMSASPDCTTCVLGDPEGTNADYPLLTELTRDEDALISGIHACIGLEAGRVDCVKPLLDRLVCGSLACGRCRPEDAAACERDALLRGCQTIAVPDGCAEAFADPDVLAACTSPGGDRVGTLKKTGRRVCVAGRSSGGEVADGGAGDAADVP